MFEQVFKTELRLYTDDPEKINRFWQEIEKNYSSKGRYYHTLTHLDNLLAELLPIRERISNWTTLIFSIAYHDIIYKSSTSNNEEMSARLAFERLSSIAVPAEICQNCASQIQATKKHDLSEQGDTNYFTDADLAILGANAVDYKNYTQAIRKEYRMYPNFLYKPGRKKVLAHFLEMPTIYKTEYFRERYEEVARENLRWELRELNGDTK